MKKNQKRILWPMITLIVLAITAVGFVTTRNKTIASAKADSKSAAKKAPLAIAAIAPQGAVQMVRFTVYDAGVFPQETHVHKGMVAIYMEDVSGNSAGLVVQSEALLRIAQVTRGIGKWRGSARISLTPGRYQLFDASRPNNRATLIVEP